MAKQFIFFMLLFVAYGSVAQRQVVLLKGQRVLWRLKGGDDFVYKLKNDKKKYSSYVNNIFDYGILAHRDTVRFNDIDRLYFRTSRFYNRLGAKLVVAGGFLFLIDQVNVSLIQGQEPSLDAWVTKVSLGALAVGLPMVLIKKKSQRLSYRYRLLTVRKGSMFYEDDGTTPFFKD